MRFSLGNPAVTFAKKQEMAQRRIDSIEIGMVWREDAADGIENSGLASEMYNEYITGHGVQTASFHCDCNGILKMRALAKTCMFCALHTHSHTHLQKDRQKYTYTNMPLIVANLQVPTLPSSSPSSAAKERVRFTLTQSHTKGGGSSSILDYM